jgi:hypothetical protein
MLVFHVIDKGAEHKFTDLRRLADDLSWRAPSVDFSDPAHQDYAHFNAHHQLD